MKQGSDSMNSRWGEKVVRFNQIAGYLAIGQFYALSCIVLFVCLGLKKNYQN